MQRSCGTLEKRIGKAVWLESQRRENRAHDTVRGQEGPEHTGLDGNFRDVYFSLQAVSSYRNFKLGSRLIQFMF